MDHLVRCEVIGLLQIVSVEGYGDDGKPVYADKSKGEIAQLDPAETNIAALTQAGLVKVLPTKAVKDIKGA